MRSFFLLAIVAITFASCQTSSYTIRGRVKEGFNGKAMLNKLEDGKPIVMDTADIKKGRFTFKGKFDEPQLYLIFIESQRNPILFFGENAKMNIIVDVEKIKEAVVTGSSINDIYSSFVNELPGSARLEQIIAEYQNAVSIDDESSMVSLKEEITQLLEEQRVYYLGFIRNNTTNVVGALMALQAINGFEIEEFKEFVTKFEANLGASKYVAELKKAVETVQQTVDAEKASEVRTAAPDFTLQSVAGASVSLSSFKGKYLLVDFWASWCGLCRRENPHVVKAYNKFAGKGFEILGVSLDREAKAWEKAIEDDGLTWTHVIDSEGAVGILYGITSIPYTLLLDKEGNVIAENLRGEQLEERLAELLD